MPGQHPNDCEETGFKRGGVPAQLSPAKRGPEVPKAAGVFMEAGRNKFMFRKPQSHTPNMMHPEKELILTEDTGGDCFNNLN